MLSFFTLINKLDIEHTQLYQHIFSKFPIREEKIIEKNNSILDALTLGKIIMIKNKTTNSRLIRASIQVKTMEKSTKSWTSIWIFLIPKKIIGIPLLCHQIFVDFSMSSSNSLSLEYCAHCYIICTFMTLKLMARWYKSSLISFFQDEIILLSQECIWKSLVNNEQIFSSLILR